MIRKVKALLNIDKVIAVDADKQHGRCLICEATGWLGSAKHGYPYGSKAGTTANLRHAADCAMNAHLHTDGSLKPLSKEGDPVGCTADGPAACNDPVAWIRRAQFQDEQPLCDAHARVDNDFGKIDAVTVFEVFVPFTPPGTT